MTTGPAPITGKDWQNHVEPRIMAEDLRALEQAIVEGTFARGSLAARNLDTLYTPGVYHISGSSADYPGAPPLAGSGSAIAGHLVVMASPGATWAAQDFVRYNGSYWERWWRTSTTTDGSWGRWQRAITSEPVYIAPPDDIDSYRTAGFYEVRTAAHAAQMANLPVALPGTLHVLATSTDVAHQMYWANADPIPWVRALAGAGSSTWQPWRQLLGSGEASTVDVGLRNALLVQDWTRRAGGPHPITAKAAVALRFDHGLNNFKHIVLPLLRSHGFKSTQALNSRKWTAAENNGVTPAEVDTWADVEVVNHGATHTDAPSLAALEDEIVTGLAELRAQLPNHQIDGWAPPGVTGTQYMGYNAGNSVASHTDTDAGRLILANHAWASGYIPDTTHRVLDGMVRHGQRHITADSATFTNFQTYVTNAIAAGRGLCIMIHPSLLDTESYMTTATLTSALAWLKTKVDAGDVQVVTVGELIRGQKG